MLAKALLKGNGKLESLLFKIPLIGEPLIRNRNRAAGNLAFKLPLLGGKRGRTIQEVRDGWKKFLKRAGITIRVTSEDLDSFKWEMDACPYGFCRPEDRGVCDAAMDLDRTYTRLLGGELRINETIPDGFSKCSYTTRLAR